jgi:hypothetical protein
MICLDTNAVIAAINTQARAEAPVGICHPAADTPNWLYAEGKGRELLAGGVPNSDLQLIRPTVVAS